MPCAGRRNLEEKSGDLAVAGATPPRNHYA
jgi:hypothetical protein